MYRRPFIHTTVAKLRRVVFALCCCAPYAFGVGNAELLPPQTCAVVPLFAKRLGFTAPSFTSADKSRPGLLMVDSQDPSRVFQHPSWRALGAVGPIAAGRSGELFFAPLPVVNTLGASPRERVTVYRVTPESGDAVAVLTIPTAALPDQTNPYGIVGLHYDCSRNKLLIASVSGSTYNSERGVIIVADPRVPQIIDTFSGVDALGISALHTSDNGSWIVFGSARGPQLYRIRWDEKHKIRGSRIPIFTIPGGGYQRARKISPTTSGIVVEVAEFRYMLVGQSEMRRPTLSLTYEPHEGLLSLQGQHEREFDPALSILAGR